MTYQKCYAYSIYVSGQKKFGGTVHADSIEDAVRRIAKRGGLTVKMLSSTLRPCDGAIIPQAEWMLGNEKANMLVWIPPEYFPDLAS